MTGVVAVSEDAPAYEFGEVKLNITTGKFMRNIFPSWFPMCNEFNMYQSFQIQAAFVPGLKIGDVPSITLPPNTNEDIMINITNTGNGRSKLQFSIINYTLLNGWSVELPPSIYLDRDQMTEAVLTIYTPNTNEEIDEWVTLPLSISQKSVVEPNAPSDNYTVMINIHCLNT